jgi:sortase B
VLYMKQLTRLILGLTLIAITSFFIRAIYIDIPYNAANKRQALESNNITEITTANKVVSPPYENSDSIVKKALETSTNEDIEKSTSTKEFSINVSENPYKELFQENSDFVGWIQIDDTPINYPVVKARDNDFYLKRNFDKKNDFYGSIFMDYRNFGIGLDKNTIIYGHNMKDGKMFGVLPSYSDEDYALKHSIIQIDTLYGTKEYKVFSAYFDEADSSLIQTQFNENEFESYVAKLIQKSSINFNQTIPSNSQILTLVTCSYEIDDGRYYIHAIEL